MLALFPGQGSQFVGMGKEVFENFKIAQRTFEEAEDSARIKIRKLCFDGSESDLRLTENTQPCLLTVSVALTRVLKETIGFQPSGVAGHSLGEYSALVAAGAFPFSKAVHWVRARGQSMQSAVPAGMGGMAAILNLTDTQVEELCSDATQLAKQEDSTAIVEPANYNAPGQVVIAGTTEALQAVRRVLELDQKHTNPKYPRCKAIDLPVSAPFHCSLMNPAALAMEQLFGEEQKQPIVLDCPYTPNRTAAIENQGAQVLKNLVQQVDHPVLWKQSMENWINQGETRALEIGPGKVLQGLAKRIAKEIGRNFEVLCLHDLASLKEMEKLK